MASLLGKIIADFSTNLISGVSAGATSATLNSATDSDGVALPSGRYFFTIDNGTASKEHISCSLSGTALTSVKTISRQGVEISGFARAHRLGATIEITDFAHIFQINALLTGGTSFDSAAPLSYTAHPTFTPGSFQIPDVKYVDDIAIAGAPDATTSTKGIGKVSVAPVSAASPIFVGDNDYRVGPNNYAQDAGSNDTYVITLTNAPAAYVRGQVFLFKAHTANTGTATLNVNSLGAKTIKRSDGSTLLTGDILTDQEVQVMYNGTDMIMQSAPANTVALVGGAYPAGDGSALTNLSLAILPTYTYGESISAGQPVYFNSSDSKVYKASASSSGDAYSNYIGIAAETGVLNDVKHVYTGRGQVVSGLSLGATTTSVSSTAAVTQSDSAGGDGLNFYTGNPSSWGFLSASNQDNVEKIDVYFGANAGVGAGQATLDLYEVTAYNSLSTITVGSSLGSVTIVSPSASSVNTFTFSSPVTIKPNTHYVIRMTASGGNGANNFTIKVNTGSISANYFSQGSNSTLTTITNIGSNIAKFTVYTTVQRNYYAGDYVYLGDTAGTISVIGGTNKMPIGRILSSSTMELGIPATRTLIGSAQQNYISSNGVYLNIPILRNTLSTDFQWSWSISTPTTFNQSATIRIGELGTKKIFFKEGNGTSEADVQFAVSFAQGGQIQTTLANAPGTFSGTTSNIYFYK